MRDNGKKTKSTAFCNAAERFIEGSRVEKITKFSKSSLYLYAGKV